MSTYVFIFYKTIIYLEFSQGINIEEDQKINIHFSYTRWGFEKRGLLDLKQLSD